MTTVEPPRPPVRGAQPYPLSVAAYHTLGEAGLIPENTELLYGFVYQKMPKSPLHSYSIQLLHDLFIAMVRGAFVLRTEQPLTCGDSEPEPDVSIVKGTKEQYRDEHPRTAELVVEVCVTSHEYDRSKLLAYALAEVKEVWLVLVPERQVEVHRSPEHGRFTDRFVAGPGGRLGCSSLPGVEIDVGALFSK